MKHAYVESRFEYKGYPCVVILQAAGHRCGYVGLTNKSSYFNVDYPKIDVSCHGGLSYAGSYLFGQEDEGVWWIGFDCAHFGDGKDYEVVRKYFKDDPETLRLIDSLEQTDRMFHLDGIVRTLEYVRAECRSIVDQLLEGGQHEIYD